MPLYPVDDDDFITLSSANTLYRYVLIDVLSYLLNTFVLFLISCNSLSYLLAPTSTNCTAAFILTNPLYHLSDLTFTASAEAFDTNKRYL